MRTRSLGLGLILAGLAATGCNDGGKSGARARLSAAAAVTSTGTGATTTTGGATTGGATATAPTITSLAPGNGPVDGGTAVIITGTNFQQAGAGTTLVIFGTRAVVVTPTSDTELQVTAPSQQVAGAVDVRVVNDLGTATRVGAFVYDPRGSTLTATPGVGSFDAVFQKGTRITLDVRAFSPLTAAATVDFGATRATTVALVDPDTIVAEVPRGLQAGAVTITVTEGASAVTAAGFRVQGAIAYGDLTVNELCLDPGGQDPNGDGTQSGGSNQSDEFVELVNTTSEAIDLSHLQLRKLPRPGSTSSPSTTHRFPNPTTVPAGGVIVVFSGGTPDEARFGRRHDRVQAQCATSGSTGIGLMLSNSSLEILSLEDGLGAVVFRVELQQPSGSAASGYSWQNVADGQRITANPATSANGSYVLHNQAAGAQGNLSAGTRSNGQPF